MIYGQWVETKWNGNNRKLFESKGYDFTGYNSILKVKIIDLSKGSNVRIPIKCDTFDCDEIFYTDNNSYLKNRIRNPNLQDYCPICIKKNRKKQIEDIFFKIQQTCVEKDYILLSKIEDYKDNKSPLEYLCIKHNDKGVLKITWDKLNRNQGCKYCGYDSLKEKQKFDFVKSKFDEKDYVLLEEFYVNSKTPMSYICKKHPNKNRKITLSGIIDGHGCRDCGNENSARKISGENHWNWKGGVTTLQLHLRNLLKSWKFNSLKASGFRCAITNSSRNLEIHHLHSFNRIFLEMMEKYKFPVFRDISEYSKEELAFIEVCFLKLHDSFGLGVVLNSKVHDEFHSIYGFENTPEQFENFKNNYTK